MKVKKIGKRQVWFLSQMARFEVRRFAFQTPWGPVEDERLRQSLVKLGLLKVEFHPELWGSAARYELTPEGRELGRREAERIREVEGWHREVFEWEAS